MFVLLVLRLLLAAAFAMAAVGKLADPAATRRSLGDFGLPRRLRGAAAITLPLVEAAAAALLVPSVTARIGAGLGLVLLVIFSVAIVRVLARGESPDCNCFGAVGSSPVGPGTLLRNLGLAGFAAAIVAVGSGESLDSLDGGTAVAIGGTLGGGLLLGLTWFSWQLFKQNGRLLARVRALEEIAGVAESKTPKTGGLAEGEAIPDIELTMPRGGSRSLSEVATLSSPVALVFSDPACGGCREMIARLPALKAELDGVVEPILITRGRGSDVEAVAERGLEVLIQEDREALFAFQIGAIPAAVIVAEGRITGAPTIGKDAIEELLHSVAEPEAPNLHVIASSGAAR